MGFYLNDFILIIRMKKTVFKRESSLKCSGDTPQKKKRKKSGDYLLKRLSK